MSPRVMLFVDYQNVHLTAHERFQPALTSRARTHIDPLRLGRLLVARRRDGGELVGVRVYRGRPGDTQQPAAAAANDRQAAAWERTGLVSAIRRPLRYPKKWPEVSAQEKGVDVALAIDVVGLALERRYDVGIVASRDSDLLPALELVADRGLAVVESASWWGTSRLSFSGRAGPWCNYLSCGDYLAVLDPTDYTVARPGP